MPTATKSQNKTSFVRDFLKSNPKGNPKAVNEAWTGAGMTGTIGATLVNKLRARMGLTGNLRARTKPTSASGSSGKSPSNSSKPVVNPGKSMFVKEFLNDHPQGNTSAVNEAWQAAGFDGDISSALVSQIRAKLGLMGNHPGTTKKSKPSPTVEKREQPRKETTPATNGIPVGKWSDAMDDMEADIDRLIFKTMAIGDLSEVEDSLRRARRLLYGALTGG